MKRVSLLPSLLTLGNFTSGFVAIILCVQSIRLHVVGNDVDSQKLLGYACFAIFLGMLFDLLDGRVARMTGAASRFGGELDSLADICSFGIAPAIVVATMWIRVQPEQAKWWSLVVICGIVYGSCAALRLARYNVEMGLRPKNYFVGLPSPGAAGAVVSTVLMLRIINRDHAYIFRNAADLYHRVAGTLGFLERYEPQVFGMYLVGIYLLLIGLLMVSRYHFVHMANRYLGGRRAFTTLVLLVFILAFFYIYPRFTLFVGFNGYVLFGVFDKLRRTLRQRRGLAGEADAVAMPAGESEESEA